MLLTFFYLLKTFFYFWQFGQIGRPNHGASTTNNIK